jgi:hypothetical protein
MKKMTMKKMMVDPGKGTTYHAARTARKENFLAPYSLNQHQL